MRLLTLATVLTLTPFQLPPRDTRPAAPPPASVRLEDIAWPDAESQLTSDAVVLLPIGAAAKEHGPHLTLANDLKLATYLTRRTAAATAVVVAPTLPYHFYPAFLEYPGSTSLSLNTARDVVVDVVRSLARYGPRRFYILNTGISTVRALEPAVKILAGDGVLVRYTDLRSALDSAARGVRQQPLGSHADEVETSMMLYIDPASVDMKKAVRDLNPDVAPFHLTRQKGGQGTYSPTGVWGDATLATREKGRTIVESLVGRIVADVDDLRKAPLPAATGPAPAPAPPPQPPRGPAPRPSESVDPATGCLPGEERSIRRVAPAFSSYWTQQDVVKLAALWTPDGDIVHPDELVERTIPVIRQNRAALFRRAEYRNSRHPLTFGRVRCISPDVAIVDGKWELRGVIDQQRQTLPPFEGLCTLVMRKSGDSWLIEAYRYTMKQPGTAAPPTVLKRPGHPA
jgi:creatinine amidohydrolase